MGLSKFAGFLRLMRFKDYAGSVVFTTCLGAVAGARESVFDWRIMLLVLANWLSVGFAFAFNDVEDAPDDAHTPEKAMRNPITNGMLTKTEGNLISFGVAGLSILLYIPLGLYPTIFGILCLIFGHLYSWRPLRLKSVPIVDVISHGLMLAGLQFLAAYFSYNQSLNDLWLAPFISMVAASSYGQLFNEVRDLEGDIKAGVTHTASLLGEHLTHQIMMVLVSLSVLAGVYAITINRLVPLWVAIFALTLVATIFIPAVIKGIRSGSRVNANEPVINAIPYIGFAMMAVWFIGPWAAKVVGLNL